MSGPPHAMLDWAGKGTAAFEAAAHRATDASLTTPSHLPGWSRAHVIAHVARNAHALVNLLTWARTGVETPMYADDHQRTNEIEANAAARPTNCAPLSSRPTDDCARHSPLCRTSAGV